MSERPAGLRRFSSRRHALAIPYSTRRYRHDECRRMPMQRQQTFFHPLSLQDVLPMPIADIIVFASLLIRCECSLPCTLSRPSGGNNFAYTCTACARSPVLFRAAAVDTPFLRFPLADMSRHVVGILGTDGSCHDAQTRWRCRKEKEGRHGYSSLGWNGTTVFNRNLVLLAKVAKKHVDLHYGKSLFSGLGGLRRLACKTQYQ